MIVEVKFREFIDLNIEVMKVLIVNRIDDGFKEIIERVDSQLINQYDLILTNENPLIKIELNPFQFLNLIAFGETIGLDISFLYQEIEKKISKEDLRMIKLEVQKEKLLNLEHRLN